MPILAPYQPSFFMEKFHMHTQFAFLRQVSTIPFANNTFSYGVRGTVKTNTINPNLIWNLVAHLGLDVSKIIGLERRTIILKIFRRKSF